MMKREEFFEALSDIDEKMIAAAGETEQPARPVIVTAPKKNKKPLFAAAACVLLAASATATAAAVLNRTQLGFVPLVEDKKEYKTIVNVINGSKYPDELYSPVHDYSSISEMKYISDKYPDYPNPSMFSSYDQLAEYSQLVVMGTFTNDSGQETAETDIPDFRQDVSASRSNKYISFNSLKVEKVLKGNGKVWAGDEIIITQPYTVVYDIDDEYNLYSFSQLTPMQKGDKWIYFLNPNIDYPEEIWGDQSYSAVNDYEGRYPVPGEENAPFKYRENVNGIVSPAVFNQSIYNELGERLEKAEQSPRPTYVMDYEKVISPFEPLGFDDGYPTGLNVEFELEEFEGVTFGWENGRLYTRTGNSEERKNVLGGTGVYVSPYNTYLCDITGDGRREICTTVSIGSGIVSSFLHVWDYYNNEIYVLDKRGERDYGLDKKDGELYLLSWKFSMYCDEDDRDEKAELLTLDMLKEIGQFREETQAPGETDQPENTQQPSENVIMIFDPRKGISYPDDMTVPFYIDDISGVRFDREPKFYGDILLGDVISFTDRNITRNLLWFDKITAIYTCDLNGDGKKEICIEALYKQLNYDTGSFSAITVYDFASNTRYVLSGSADGDVSRFDYFLEEKDDVLYIVKSEEDAVVSEEPLTLDADFTKYDKNAFKNITEHKFGEENAKRLFDSWFESNLDRLHETLEFRLEEFPDVIFRKRISDEPIADKDIFEIELPSVNTETVMSGFQITAVYIGDVNDDEYREICISYAFESPIDAVESPSMVVVIDYANKKVYTMRDNEHDFRLDITDDKVMVSWFDYETGEWVDDGSLDIWSMDIFGGGDN